MEGYIDARSTGIPEKFGELGLAVSSEKEHDMFRDEQGYDEACPVCGDKVSGYHYGLLTCESCKGFFKRTVQNKKMYSCVENKKCFIDKTQRKRCPYCRYQKCLQVGMKLEAVRSDRMRGGRNKFGPLYKQDRARKQQLQAFHKAKGILKIIDNCGSIHTVLENDILRPHFGLDQKHPTSVTSMNHILTDRNGLASQWTIPSFLLPTTNMAKSVAAENYTDYEATCVKTTSNCTVGNISTSTLQLPKNLYMQQRSLNERHCCNIPYNDKVYLNHEATKRETEKHVDCRHLPCENLKLSINQASFKQGLAATVPLISANAPRTCCSHVHSKMKSCCCALIPSSYKNCTCFSTCCEGSITTSKEIQETNSSYHVANMNQHDKNKCEYSFPSMETDVIQTLLKGDIDQKEIQFRTMMRVGSLPEHGFRFICEVANASLFLLVEWAKSSTHFQKLKTSDQMTLLQNGWMDILVFEHVYRQVELTTDSILFATGHHFPRDICDRYVAQLSLSSDEKSIVQSLLQRSAGLTTKLRNLRLDRTEFVCIKFLILFNTDASAECKTYLKRMQNTVNRALWDYSSKREFFSPDRVGQLLYTLSEIRALSLLCEEYLLKQYHQGNTPNNNLLMEMFHAKQNVTIR